MITQNEQQQTANPARALSLSLSVYAGLGRQCSLMPSE